MKKKNFEIDMCNGPLLPKLLLFSIPLILSGVLQLLFNAADMIVVGQYAANSEDALAAIGATSSLINFFVNVIIGISVGANVMVARYFGAKKERDMHDTVHTSIAVCIILGIVVGILGFLFSRPILKKMDTPDNVLDLAVLYIRIYFMGLPAMVLFNFGSAILRAVGDTSRPLIYLTVAGILNTLLNLLFVIRFDMSVDGVALATVLSQILSAFLVLRCLMKTDAPYRLIWKDLSINKHILKKILYIGLPAGVQGMIFSISNILIQSSVNYFGSVAMAGNTACANLEGFVYTAMNAIHQTALSFTGQNFGAGKYKRINRVLFYSMIIVFLVGFVMGNIMNYFGEDLLRLYSPQNNVIQYGMIRMQIIMTTYFLCGFMDVMVGSLRGLGFGIMPMLVSLIGACGLRILWVFTIFEQYRTLESLYYSYPVTWGITVLAHVICFCIVRRRFPKEDLVSSPTL